MKAELLCLSPSARQKKDTTFCVFSRCSVRKMDNMVLPLPGPPRIQSSRVCPCSSDRYSSSSLIQTSTFDPISFHTDERSSVVFGPNRQEGILTGFDLLFWCEWCGCDVLYLRMRVVLSVACTRLVMVVLLTRSQVQVTS